MKRLLTLAVGSMLAFGALSAQTFNGDLNNVTHTQKKKHKKTAKPATPQPPAK